MTEAGNEGASHRAGSHHDELQVKVAAWHRSSDNLKRMLCDIAHDTKEHKIRIDFNNGEKKSIKLEEIQDVKMKDISLPSGTLNCLDIKVVSAVGDHVCFEFEKVGTRDTWYAGLRTLLSDRAFFQGNNIRKSLAKKVDPLKDVGSSKYQCVKNIELLKASNANAVSLRVDLDNEKGVNLDVPAGSISAEAIKDIANSFMDKHKVLPTENTSLYRLLRSLVQRSVLEKETSDIVAEINALHYDQLPHTLKDELGKHHQPAGVEARRLASRAESRLNALHESIPNRIGQHGPGASIISQILQRNVAKMKLINDRASKIAAAEAAANQGNSPRPSPTGNSPRPSPTGQLSSQIAPPDQQGQSLVPPQADKTTAV